MSPEERFERVADLFASAVDLPPTEQKRFLSDACAGDTELLRQVLELLEADTSGSAKAEEIVGRYRIIKELGRGGMGVVHLAIRDDDYQQEVALKRFQGDIALGADLVDQFRKERQILARLQHPSIVQLLDGGSTALGRPYLVMQYVEGGVHLDKYCQRNRLSLTSRLQLFLKICEAVQYAHQKTIVHRDLKPNNILVTPSGEPKLLDFGLANVLTETNSEKLKRANQSTAWEMGTFGYASPEQLQGMPSDDIRTDVYALGAILYELLSGSKANPATDINRQEFIARVCHHDPVLPSEAALAALQPMAESPARLSRMLRGDLDMIVRKAMARDINQRYSSVEKLVSGVRCWLEYRPIPERRHSALYRMGRFIRRRRAPVAIAAVVLLASSVSLATFLRQKQRVMRADARAARSLDGMRDLARRVVGELHDAIEDIPGAADARRLLLHTASEALEKLAKDAESDVRFREGVAVDLANAYIRTGDLQSRHSERNTVDVAGAQQSYQKALEWLNRAPASSQTHMLQAKANERLAEVQIDVRDGGDKARLQIEQVRSNLATDTSPPAQLVQSLLLRLESAIARQRGQSEKAQQAIERAMDLGKRLRDSNPANKEYQRELDRTYDQFAELAIRARWLPPAGHSGTWNILTPKSIAEIRKAYDLQQETLQQAEARRQAEPRNYEETRRVARIHKRLGTLSLQLGETTNAVKSYQSALALFRNLKSASPSSVTAQEDIARCQMELAETLMQMEARSGEASSHAVESLRALEQLTANPETRSDIARVLGITGNLQYRQGQNPQALASFERAKTIHRDLLNSDSANLALQKGLMLNHRDMAYVEDQLDRSEAALKDYDQAVDIGNRILAHERDDVELQVAVASARNDRGNMLSIGLRQVDKARSDLEAARKLLERTCSEQTGPFPCRCELGITYSLLGRVLRNDTKLAEQAANYYQRGTSLFERLQQLDRNNRDVKSRLFENQVSYAQSIARRDLEGAIAIIEKGLVGFSQLYRQDPGDYATRVNLGIVHSFLGEAYVRTKKGELAMQHFTECVGALRDSSERHTEGGCYMGRGGILLGMKNSAAAKADFEKACGLLTEPQARARALVQLAQVQENNREWKEAINNLETAKRLTPANTTLQEALDRIRRKQQEK